MGNTKNDYEKHVECFENYLEGLYGDGWEDLCAKEICKLMAKYALGLNGGSFEEMADAADVVGFDSHNIVPTRDGCFQVMTMIEFTGEEATVH